MTAAATQIGFHTDEASAAHTAMLEHVEPQWLPRAGKIRNPVAGESLSTGGRLRCGSGRHSYPLPIKVSPSAAAFPA
jgi:hypothetical protein